MILLNHGVAVATPVVPLRAVISGAGTALGATSATAATISGGIGATAGATTLMVGSHLGGYAEKTIKKHIK